VAEPPAGLAGVLRGLRAGAGLTQEELAEAAGLSPRTVSDLERGLATTPHKDTVRLLADALQLGGGARVEFEAAARGHTVPGRVRGRGVAATRTLPATSPRSPGASASSLHWLRRRPGRAGW
jgi:transcriptional regulator with XRE-family HTH domain